MALTKEQIDALSVEDLQSNMAADLPQVWFDGGPGEAKQYYDAGLQDPWLAKQWAYKENQVPGVVPTWLDTVLTQRDYLDPVNALGMANQRFSSVAPDSESRLKAYYGSLGYGDTGAWSSVPSMLGLSPNSNMISWMGDNTAAAQAARDDDGGFGDLLGPLAMMAAFYFMGPGAGMFEAGEGAALAGMGEGATLAGAGEVGSSALAQLQAANAAAGLTGASQAAPWAAAALTPEAEALGPALYDAAGYTGAQSVGAQFGRILPDNILGQAQGALGEVSNAIPSEMKDAYKVANTAKKVYDIYGALTQDSSAAPQQVSAQQSDPRRGYMSQPFGNRNFDSYR